MNLDDLSTPAMESFMRCFEPMPPGDDAVSVRYQGKRYGGFRDEMHAKAFIESMTLQGKMTLEATIQREPRVIKNAIN